MDDAEREMWCRAWRLVLQHGDAVSDHIDNEMARLLREGNTAAIAEWRQISLAVEHLSD
jgi:hypothetical protein